MSLQEDEKSSKDSAPDMTPDVKTEIVEPSNKNSNEDTLLEPILANNSEEQQPGNNDGDEEEQEPSAAVIIEELPPLDDDDGDIAAAAAQIPSSHKPLAWAYTTPRWATYFIPLAALATHALFLYGQIEPMWYLHQSQKVDMWYNASSTATSVFYKAVGLPHDLEITHEAESTIQTFTYSFAIHELWEAKGMPGSKLIPRLASVLLALFSGVWPHLKLLLLNGTWLMMRHPQRRTRTLHWLSCLGKWSLADILVVCVMVGVLHIDWVVDPEAIRKGVSKHLPFLLQLLTSQFPPKELCTKLLKYDCFHPSALHFVQCEACTGAFTSTDWTGSAGQAILNGVATSGGGLMSLRVIGMRGIYAFCAAVVISILLSLMVDVWDHRARNYALLQTVVTDEDEEDLLLTSEEDRPATRYMLLEGNDDTEEEADAISSQQNQPLLMDSHLSVEMGGASTSLLGDNDDVAVFRSSSIPIRWCSCFHGFVSFIVVIAVTYTCFTATFERRVVGAIPTLLNQVLGMEWTEYYSLQSLGEMTGAAGGWDYMLQATFGLFIVFGPIVRSCLCVLGHLLPGRLTTIQTFCDLIGAFCAWEVLVIAVIMIGLLMPSITGTILSDSRCSEVDKSGNCFQVYYETLSTFYVLIVTGFALVIVSNSFTFFAKQRKVATNATMAQR
mmetsp:Transcript_32704/g.49288  ORF Transcript_32704/g.49288 Transcript_32704/m.49288 type:complete len:669 (+) Transcript_32704:187-2193(+)